jgi:predicted helicase
MGTFEELRSGFSPDANKRGAQFERVCKWLLEKHPVYACRLKQVWLWDDWPGRWGPDCGIDLVAQDGDGKTWAIQTKCYDADYSVTKKDIDSFLAESVHSRIDHRLLIATTDRVGANARRVIRQQSEVVPVSQLLLADLEAAPVTWPISPDRLTGGKPHKPSKPRPHQRAAINNVAKNLDRRGQTSSPNPSHSVQYRQCLSRPTVRQ